MKKTFSFIKVKNGRSVRITFESEKIGYSLFINKCTKIEMITSRSSIDLSEFMGLEDYPYSTPEWLAQEIEMTAPQLWKRELETA
jgi:hypothetical protein